MSTMEASEALKDHLKNHLSDLLQTHESYQIQWESRLNNAVARCRKEIWIAIVYVDFQIMRLKIEIYDELAWNIRWLNFSVTLWDQSWTSLDYWRIFEDPVRVEVQSRFCHSKTMHKFFVTLTALEILSQVLRQNRRFIQTYETLVHMNQPLCTSWCFIKSTKIQITCSWIRT